MCRAGVTRKKFMDENQLKTILDYFPEAIIIIFSWIGESFLSEKILEMIRYMSFKNRRIVSLSSNFSVISDPYAVLDCGLYEINTSIDTFDPEKFSKIREWGNLDRSVSNLKALLEARRKKNRKIPIINISAVASKETLDDAEDIIKNALELGVDRVKFQKLIFSTQDLTEPDKEDFKYLLQLKEKYKNKINVILSHFQWGGDYPQGYCFFAHFNLTIDVFGNTHTCFMPYHLVNTGTFGNVISHPCKKVNDERIKLVKNFRKRIPDFCASCAFYLTKHQ